MTTIDDNGGDDFKIHLKSVVLMYWI